MSTGRVAPQGFWRKELQGEDLREAAFSFADALWNSDREVTRRADFLVYASQYLGRPIASLSDFEERQAVLGAANGGSSSITVGYTTRNLTRTLTDTAMSRFAKSETRVQYLTNGGTEIEQDKAEEATDAANALIEQTQGEVELRKAALHACVFDLGIVKKIDTPDGPECEHVPSWEYMYDPADAHRGKPSIRVHRFPMDRDALIVKFLAPVEGETPEQTDARQEKIERIKSGSGTTLVAPDSTTDENHVIVYSLWRDPIGKRPGRYVVVTEAVLLNDEPIAPTTARNAPFSLFGYSAPVVGSYPTSIAAIVSRLQAEIDGMKDRRAQILRLCAVPRYLKIGPDSGSTDGQLRGGTDAIGDTINVPPGVTVTALPLGIAESLTALREEEDAAWAKGFEMVGVNPSNAIGSRPNGLNSAPAQREWNDIAQDRLSLVALEYQRAHVDLGRQLLDSIAAMPDYAISIKDPNGRFLKKVKAADLKLGESDYVLIPFPIGALPTTPTGKLAAAGDLLQMGALDKDQFQQIVQLPDLKAQINMNEASQRATAKLVAKMLSSGESFAPPECLEPTYALRYVTWKWLDGTASDLDQHKLDLLQSWMDTLTARIAKKSAPAGAGAPAPVMGAGRVGAQPVPLQAAGIAPLQNAEFAPPPGPMPGGIQ